MENEISDDGIEIIKCLNSRLLIQNNKPVKIYLDGFPIPEFVDLMKIVKSHGGEIASRDEAGVIVLSPPEYSDTKRHKFDVNWLHDCIQSNKILNPSKYQSSVLETLWIIMDDFRNRNAHRIAPRNHFQELTDFVFRSRYRLSKRAFVFVLRRIIHGLRARNGRNCRISPTIQLLVALRFYATGSYLMTVGDCLRVSKTSAWEIVHRVSPLIAALSDRFIRFPATPDEIRRTQGEMFLRSGFPRIVGAVDGKQVLVQYFGGENAELFRNRHGWFSINVQGICNARLEFINFVARWPGSTHDSTIFQASRICRSFENGEYGDALLVGDSGYPNLPFLMTPLRNPDVAEEQLYNGAQIRTRNPIERCFGVWARRFAVVRIGSRFHTVERALTVIQATAVLHNVALLINPFRHRNVNMDVYNRIHDNVEFGEGDTIREQLINGYFRRLI